jgi:hypothetical protein
MISDILCECVDELDYYLSCPIFGDVYQGELRDRIIRLRNEAEYLRSLLDAPTGVRLPSEAVLLARIDARCTADLQGGRPLLLPGIGSRRPRMALSKEHQSLTAERAAAKR